LIKDGHNVIVLDNLITGKRRNIEHWVGHPNFQFILHDAVQPIYLEVDEIYHLASPASPPQYMKDPIKTIMANTEGTRNMLGKISPDVTRRGSSSPAHPRCTVIPKFIPKRRNIGAMLIQSVCIENFPPFTIAKGSVLSRTAIVLRRIEASGRDALHGLQGSRECGRPHRPDLQHLRSQDELGPRSCYDESKRLGETLCMAYRDRENVDVRIARIFNTFGPRMSVQDGRVVSNFIIQALSEEPITIYGKGKNTRSFQYVSDLVEGLIALMSSNYTMPVNLGNPDEYEVGEFATLIKKMTGSKSEIRKVEGVRDDPTRRKPDISLAWKVLGWKPKVSPVCVGAQLDEVRNFREGRLALLEVLRVLAPVDGDRDDDGLRASSLGPPFEHQGDGAGFDKSSRCRRDASREGGASYLSPGGRRVTGGAGFVGSHLVDRLIKDGHNVIVLDNLITGKRRNIEHWVDEIYHLASPASPPQYMKDPIKTILANTEGTRNMLDLARRNKARFLFTSTSEVYGDPQVHPQNEEYWGNVNPVGPRSCYDESKRLGETLCLAYRDRENVDVRIARIFNTFGSQRRAHFRDRENVDVRIARIFNTFGLRMSVQDGRVVSNFIIQALSEEPISIYGEGKNTRSFQYVSDLVDGLVALMDSNYTMPMNLGNPDEYEIGELALLIKNMTESKSEIKKVEGVRDDPTRRKPDISLAWKILSWKPKVQVVDGLQKTIQYFKDEMKQVDFKTRNLYIPWEDKNLET
ncbi:unnamed protein product, partial [Darwinula stevensoni]